MRDITPALEIIKHFEGFSAKPYLCPAKIPTIGYGSTTYPDGTKVTLKDPPITKEYATDCLRAHIAKDQKSLESFLSSKKIVLNDNQFSALLSFVYNCGLGPLSPGKSLYQSLIKNSPEDVVKSLKLYVRATVNGKRIILNGLVRRREAEASLYLKC